VTNRGQAQLGGALEDQDGGADPDDHPEHREAAIREAGYNTFLLQSDDVYIDLLTDSGTSAMSENQWAGLMLGDEAYAGSRSYRHLCEAIEDVYGYPETVPTHQGRGAEQHHEPDPHRARGRHPRQHVLHHHPVPPGVRGGKFVDVIIDEAHDPASTHPFKGNVDLAKLARWWTSTGLSASPTSAPRPT